MTCLSNDPRTTWRVIGHVADPIFTFRTHTHRRKQVRPGGVRSTFRCFSGQCVVLRLRAQIQIHDGKLTCTLSRRGELVGAFLPGRRALRRDLLGAVRPAGSFAICSRASAWLGRVILCPSSLVAAWTRCFVQWSWAHVGGRARACGWLPTQGACHQCGGTQSEACGGSL